MKGLIHTCTLQKRAKKQKFTYTGGTGTPTVGQTVTGSSSLKTAVVDKVGTGYIVVKTLSGTFINGETISTTTFSGTLSSQADYQNQSGEYDWYWSNDQTGVTCRFYYGGRESRAGEESHEAGQIITQALKCALPNTCTVDALEYRIVSTTANFTGTWNIVALYPRTGSATLHHYEAVLKVMP